MGNHAHWWGSSLGKGPPVGTGAVSMYMLTFAAGRFCGGPAVTLGRPKVMPPARSFLPGSPSRACPSPLAIRDRYRQFIEGRFRAAGLGANEPGPASTPYGYSLSTVRPSKDGNPATGAPFSPARDC
jgi:hypothetical protein